MTKQSLLNRILGNEKIKEEELNPSSNNNNEIEIKEKRIIGKIIKLNKDGGWGFISSKDIPFTRIFFHWSALVQDTLNFIELKTKMEVEFTPYEYKDQGWRAKNVKVLESKESDEEEYL
jgi:cold shock CspA family protein